MDLISCLGVTISILLFIYFLIDVKIIDYLDKDGWGKLIVMMLVLIIILWVISMLYSCSNDEPSIIEYEQYLNNRIK